MTTKKFITMLLALLPMSMAATTLVTDPATGLKWLDDSNDAEYVEANSSRYYILVSTSSKTAISTSNAGNATARDFIKENIFAQNIAKIFAGTHASGDPAEGKVKVTKAQILAKTELSFSGAASLFQQDVNGTAGSGGIEYFTEMTKLTLTTCSTNNSYPATTLDLSKNTKLTSVTITNATKIATLILPSTTALTVLDLQNTNMTVKADPDLNTLITNNKQLQVLRVPGCTNLTDIDLSGHTKLMSLNLRATGVKEINVSNLPELLELYCQDTPVEVVNAAGCKKLNTFEFNPTESDQTKRANTPYMLRYLNLSGCQYLGLNTASSYLALTNAATLQYGGSGTNVNVDKDTKKVAINETNYPTSKNSNYSGYPYPYCQIEYVDISGTGYKRVYCHTSLLKHFIAKDCKKLEYISLQQGLLESDSIDLSGCTALVTFNAHRQRFTHLNFLEDVSSLKSLQVNGGTYGPYVFDDYGETRYYPITNAITEVDGTQLSTNIERFYVRYNVIQTLNLTKQTEIATTQIDRNRLLATDLKNITKIGTLSTADFLLTEQRSWEDLVLHKDRDASGNVTSYEYRIYFPDEQADAMDLTKLSEKVTLNGVEYTTNAKTEGTRKYISIPVTSATSDINMYEKDFTYKYETEGMEGDATYGPQSLMDVRLTVYPYIMYVNPQTMSGEGVEYYSGTLYLDYDAIVPSGVTAWIATGVKDTLAIKESGTKQVESQLHMVKVGDPGDIIPANTPIYVRALKPSEDSESGPGLYAFDKAWEPKYIGWIQRDENGNDVNELTFDPITKSGHSVSAAMAANRDRNILRGSTTATPVEEKSVMTLGREKYYKKDMIGFWLYKGTTIPAYRCYIPASELANVNSEAKGAIFHFDDEGSEATGMDVVVQKEVKVSHDGAWYTLYGVRLSGKPTAPGVYFHGGKKVVVN